MLVHIINGAVAQGLQGCVFGNGSRDEQERHLRELQAGDLQGPGAGEARQGPVGQDRVRALQCQGGAKAGLIVHAAKPGLHAGAAQGIADQFHIQGLILHQQQIHAHRVSPGTLLSSIQERPSSATAFMNASDSTGFTR